MERELRDRSEEAGEVTGGNTRRGGSKWRSPEKKTLRATKIKKMGKMKTWGNK